MPVETSESAVESAALGAADEAAVSDYSSSPAADNSAEAPPAAEMSRSDAISAALGYSAENGLPIENENQTPMTDLEKDSHPAAALPATADEIVPDGETEKSDEAKLEEFFQQTSIMSDEEIDALRIANTAKEAMKKYAATARAHQELSNAVGSSELLPHAIENFKALQESANSGDFYEYLKSVAHSSGFDGLFGLMDETMFRVFSETSTVPADPTERLLYEATLKIADKNFQARFGEGYTMEKIGKLIKADQNGLVDFDLIDSSESPVANVKSSPEYLELQNQYRQLSEKVASLEPKSNESGKTRPEAAFEQMTADGIKNGLKSVVESPVFQPVAGDAPEIVEMKEVLSSTILTMAEKNFRQSAKYDELLTKFQNNTISLPKFKAEYENAIRQAYLNTGSFTLKAQKLISSLYKRARNVTVKERLYDSPLKDEAGNPTQTTRFTPDIPNADQNTQNRRLAIERAIGQDTEKFKPYPKQG